MPVATYDAAESLIRKTVQAEFTAELPDVELYHDNQKVEPPALEAISVSSDSLKHCWGRLSVLWGDSVQAEIVSDPRYRTAGTVIVQIFSPAGRGSSDAMTIADTVVSLLRRVRLDGMTFRAPSPVRVGSGLDGWYQVNVNAPMYLDVSPT